MLYPNKQSLALGILSFVLTLLPVSALSSSKSDFEKFDLNRDSQLSASEFLAAKYSIKDFKAADTNQNQSVSMVEFASFKTGLSKPQERPSSGPHPPHG